MNETTTTPNQKKPRKSPLDSLNNRKETLERQLADTKAALRQKLAAKAAREASLAKKNRTQSLILLGLLFTRLLHDMNEEDRVNFLKAAEYYHKYDLDTLTALTDPKRKPDQLATYKARRRAALDREHGLLTAIMKNAINGTFK